MSETSFDPALLINALTDATKGEALAVLIARQELQRLVVADSRTRDLFARWRHEGKLDGIVAEWSAQLDAAAARAGLAHRSELRDAAMYSRLSVVTRAICERWRDAFTDEHTRSTPARAAEVIRFVCVVLYNDPSLTNTKVSGWLGLALLKLFDAEIERDVWGEPDARQPPIRVVIPKAAEPGQNPMHNGEHLERDVQWYYRFYVKVPKATKGKLAREYYTVKTAGGVHLQPKDTRGIIEIPDTKSVRDGIKRAKYLLEDLANQPEQYLQNVGLTVGGETV